MMCPSILRFWRNLLRGLAVSAASGAVLCAAETKPPNVILILADDLGYECIGANGNTSYRTPVLDKLAANGARFERCHAQPLCTPTRVQLMTGIYNVRNYRNFGTMDADCVTFANILQKAGYATCMAGKWQLGPDPGLPKKFGFDEYCLWQHTRVKGEKTSRYRNPGLEINGVPKDFPKEYGPDIINQYVLDFIQREKDKPFFVYYSMLLTHSPYEPTPDSTDYGARKSEGGKPGPDGITPNFADMVAYMDKLIGRLTAKLDELGIRDNTLIMLLGDNGTAIGTMSMMGDRKVHGAKGVPIEAGMRVPLIVSWPAKAPAGTVSEDLVDTTDFLPTICEAAGVPLPEGLQIDGRSFLPQVRGEKGNPREWYYCWYGPHDAVTAEFAATRDFKLSRTGDFYDLRSDIEEKHPRKVAELSGEAAAAAKLLQGALDQYRDARPADMAKPFTPQKKMQRLEKKGKKAKDGKNKASSPSDSDA